MNLILQRVDDSELIRRIDSANSSVALYAPGVSVTVAQALHRAAWRLGGAIKVVLDVSQKSVDMGIIERYGSGIKRIKKECDKNGNPYPEWSDIYGEFATTYRPRFASGERQKDNEIDGTGHGDKRSDKKSDKKSDKEILEFLKANPSATIEEMQEFSGFSSGGIRKVLYRLKNANLLRRVGPDKGGHWEVVKGGGR